MKLIVCIAVAGIAIGAVAGTWLGAGLTRLYADFFHFPILEYRLAVDLMAQAIVISIVAAVVGALTAVRRVVLLPPAVAMRPEAPPKYNETWVERSGLKGWMSQPARMVARNLQRQLVRTGLSVVGIAFGGALLIVGTFTMDSMNHMLDVQFNVAQRYDAMVSFIEPVSPRGIYDVRNLPGVISAEPFRAVAARLRFENRWRNTAITGLPEGPRLNRIIDASLRPVTLPPDGLVLSAKLAQLLGVRAGDTVSVEVLVESQPVRDVPVVGLVDDFMGANAYMNIDALHRMMSEGDVLSGAYLQVDDSQVGRFYHAVKTTPAIAGATLKGAAIQGMQDTLAEMFAMVRTVTVLFAAIIAFGVVYNTARISLSERSRELATLRVIGFRRSEIAFILIGELAVITLMAIPLGAILGYGLASAVVTMYDTEVYRMPMVVAPQTFALSAVVVVFSAVLSALAVRGRLRRLDLIGVLKTRE